MNEVSTLKVMLWVFCIFVGITIIAIVLPEPPERTLMCDDKLIIKSRGLYLDNNMWVWNNGTYTPEGGEICVLIKGEDK